MVLSAHPPTPCTYGLYKLGQGHSVRESATHATWGTPTGRGAQPRRAGHRASALGLDDTAPGLAGVTRVDRRHRHRHGHNDPTRPTCTRIALDAQRAPRGPRPLSFSSPTRTRQPDIYATRPSRASAPTEAPFGSPPSPRGRLRGHPTGVFLSTPVHGCSDVDALVR